MSPWEQRPTDGGLSKLRIGIVGCGHVARTVHVPLLERHPLVELTAVADSDDRAIAACAGIAPRARRFGDYRELLASRMTDAVVIALPTHLHRNSAIAAFAAGMDVYLEKPVASSLADAREVLDAWRASKRIGMIGHNYRFNPLYRELRDQIAGGKIGRPLSATTLFATPASGMPDWKRLRSTGGGALLDLGVHHVDLLRFLLAGEVTSVSATITSRATEHDTVHMTVEMTGGASAEVSALLGEKFCDSVRIWGDDGELWVDRATSLSVGFARPGSPDTPRARIVGRFPTLRRLAYLVAKLRSPFSEPSFAPALDTFVRCALSGTNPSPDLDDGFASLAVADAAERSALAGKPVLTGNGGVAVTGSAPAGLS